MKKKLDKLQISELKEINESKLMKVKQHKKGEKDDMKEKLDQQK